MAPASTTHSDAPTNEKVDSDESRTQDVHEKKVKKGLFGKSSKSSPKTDEDAAKEKQSEADAAKTKQLPPASFSSLFRCVAFGLHFKSTLISPPRFSTRLELTLNAIGLVCAAAGGAAQVRPIGLSSPCSQVSNPFTASYEFALRTTHAELRRVRIRYRPSQ